MKDEIGNMKLKTSLGSSMVNNIFKKYSTTLQPKQFKDYFFFFTDLVRCFLPTPPLKKSKIGIETIFCAK